MVTHRSCTHSGNSLTQCGCNIRLDFCDIQNLHYSFVHFDVIHSKKKVNKLLLLMVVSLMSLWHCLWPTGKSCWLRVTVMCHHHSIPTSSLARGHSCSLLVWVPFVVPLEPGIAFYFLFQCIQIPPSPI